MVIENEARINSEFVKVTEGETPLSVKQEAVVDLLEPSNTSSSKFIEDTEENARKIDGDEGVVDPSKGTEGNENLGLEVRTQESQEANENEVLNQPKAVDANDKSKAIKAIEGESQTWTLHEADFDPNQSEFKDDSSNPVNYKEIKVKFCIYIYIYVGGKRI